MNLALKALAGPRKDSVFPLKEGLTLGRQGADIILRDPKLSTVHARVVKVGEAWHLEDNNSKNGLRIEGRRVTSVPLIAGQVFFAGDSQFLVVDIKPPEKPKPLKKQRYWHSVLAEFVDEYAFQFEDKPRPVTPLEPALVLEFVRGAQVNSKWILGFGPRKIGGASLDLPIWEPGAPATCFEILPTSEGLLFKTPHPDIVRLNGEAIDSQVLRMGDTIRILETMIEVDFAE